MMDLLNFDKFKIPITVGNFRIGKINEVVGFYRQLCRKFKQGKNNLGIICVLCAKALYGNNEDQWTCVEC